MDAFFHHIDPTDPDGQICDHGPTYRTAVFAADAGGKGRGRGGEGQVAKELQAAGGDHDPAGRDASGMGEDYHQDYARKNPAAYMAYRVGCGRDRALKAVWGGR